MLIDNIKNGGKGMVRKIKQHPLLYIQQPVFDKQTAQMQQFFITKKTKENTIQEERSQVEKEVMDEEPLQDVIPESVTNVITAKQNVIESNYNELSPLIEEESGVNVMEFMLESILNPWFDKELNIDFDNQEEVYGINNIHPSHDNELQSIGTNDANKGKFTRIPFNELTLENKLRKIRKVPAFVVKILYTFVTEEKTYEGYFLSAKEGELSILPLNSLTSINIPEQSIIDIKTAGL
jgi:hypothetical protein